MPIEFNVEARFQEYCKRVHLDLDACHPVQVLETRRAYFGAVGEVLLFLRDELSELSEDDGVEELKKAHAQVSAFWERQAQNGRGRQTNE